MMNEGLSVADAIALQRSGGYDNGNGMFGGEWAWIILLLLFGWGGFGGFGGGFGGGAGLQGMATRADINEGFALNNITSGIQAIQQGICDSTYALNNAITSGFNGVERGFCNLSSQLANCCCETQRAIDGVNYNLATQSCDTRNIIQNATRDILESNNNNTRAILDFLTQDKISTLTTENQALKFQASQSAQNAFITANQDAQTAELIRRLGAEQPSPAYIVPNPNCCYDYTVTRSACCGCNNNF